MKEGQPSELPYELTHDAVFETGSSSAGRGAYRIRIFEKPGTVPIILAADTSEEHAYGVSRVTRYLAAEVLAKHFTSRLWEDRPMRWIEEETKVRKEKGQLVERREYREVAFRSFLPRRVKVFGDDRYQIDEETRRPLKAKELEGLLGQKLT